MHAREHASELTRRPWPERRGSFRVRAPASDVRPTSCCAPSVFDAADLRRALTRIAHEIVERNHGADDVVLVGLYTRGVALAQRLAAAIASFEGVEPCRSARSTSPSTATTSACGRSRRSGPTEVPDIAGKVVVLVDDVLFTGRTARAALDALLELGRPRAVQLAVLVDRGHRELPLRADFVGKNLPTRVERRRARPARRGRRRRRRRRALGPAGRSVVKHLLSVDDLAARPSAAHPTCAGIEAMLDLTDVVRRGARSATSRRCPRCAARPSCRSSTRTRPARGSRSRPRRSGSSPTR